MARFAKDQGFEKVAILAVDNAFGKGLTDVFTKEYESKFRQVVGVFKFPDTQSEGFGDMIEEVKALDPDGIYIVSYDRGLIGLLNEMHERDCNAVLMGTSSVPENLPKYVGEAADKLVFPKPGFDLESNDPAVVNFIAAYRQKYGEDPDSYAAHGYDALKLVLTAIETAESTHPMNVKVGLHAVKEYKGAAGVTAFDKNGDVVRYPRLFVIHNGRTIPYERFREEGLTLASSG